MAETLNRRELLTRVPPTLATLHALAGLWPQRALAAPPAISGKFLLNVHLDGAPDMRHVFAPKPDPDAASPAHQFWKARSAVYGIGQDFNSWTNAFSAVYDPVSFSGVDFGILKEAGWLKRQWDLGRVAIINNVFVSDSRDHVFGSVVVQTGYTNLGGTDRNRDGFGGRLVKALNANVIGFHGATQFCYAPHPSDPTGHTLDRIISVENARRMGFHQSNGRRVNRVDTDSDAVVERSLESFYRGKDPLALHPAHRNFPTFEQLYRALGKQMTDRLAPIVTPEALVKLAVRDGNVRNEFRACYESLLCADILNLRAGYIFYGGWDTHDAQLGKIKELVTDLFGDSKALDSLFSSLEANHPTAADNMTMLLAGEFGRKLRANEARGTDHGIGNSVLVIGKQVRGGLYGSMFPQSEVGGGVDNLYGYDNAGGEIQGLTALEHVYGVVAEHIQHGIGTAVSPRMNAVMVERGGLLTSLFK
ncbi:MAG TPA: DUF1501 domain-containing protein [Vineibacter sp.]|nr:DUF1501 domain-containing protein [Vineibacter sp.]